MKLLFISLFFVLPVHSMHRPRLQQPKRSATLTTDPTSFADLSRDLMVAIRQIDVKKVKVTLDALSKLGKKPEELSCLEEETFAFTSAIQDHYKKRSERVAELSAMALVEKLSKSQLKSSAFPESSEVATLEHAHAIIISNMVNTFFRLQTPPYSDCDFSLTPPLPSVQNL